MGAIAFSGRFWMTSSAGPADIRTSLTPILDRLAPLPRPAARGSASGIIAAGWFGLVMAIPAILAFWHPPWIRSLWRWTLANFAPRIAGPWTAADLALAGVSVVGIATAVIAIHELGHVLVGIWAGFRISSMRVGPLRIDRAFRISRYRGPGAWIRGEVIMDPVKSDRLIPRAVAMVFAGPAANLLSGCAVIWLPFPHGLSSGVFVLSSLAAGLVELLVPYRSSSVVFDGARIAMLLRDRERGERWLALMTLGAELRDGAQPESLSADFLARAVAVCDDSPETVAAHAIAYLAAFHQHRDTEAARALETCLRHSSSAAPALRGALMSDAAVFQARRRKRVDLAEQWLGDLRGTPGFPWLPARAEAAIREARGDLEGALDKLEEVERAILAVPEVTQRGISLRFLKRWKSELRENVGRGGLERPVVG
jgi:hypothetical protein